MAFQWRNPDEPDLELWKVVLALLPSLGLLWVVVTGASVIRDVLGNQSLRTKADDTASDQASPDTKEPEGKAKTSIERNATKDLSEEEKRVKKDIVFRDRILFTLGVFNVGYTTWLMGVSPAGNFPMWHSIKVVALITYRFFDYRAQGYHYFLWDLCYWVNGISLVFLWIAPHKGWLFEDFFILANGPLAWSVVTFQNALVFHSQDKMISCFIHISPMLLSYALRWHSTDTSIYSICRHKKCFTPIVEQVVWAEVHFYLPWIVLYYVIVLVCLEGRVHQRGYLTLYDYVSTKGALKGIMPYVPSYPKLQKAFYCIIHYLFALLTALLAGVLWKSFFAHTVFVMSVCFCAAWNGAGYYFTYFPKRYLGNVDKEVEKELNAKQE